MYASGKHAIGLCDQCGRQYPLHQLKEEVVNQKYTGIKACPECWDPDQPQLQVGKQKIYDPQALYKPRPSPNNDRDIDAMVYPVAAPLQAILGNIYEFRTHAIVTGISCTATLGTPSLLIDSNIFVSGMSVTASLGVAKYTASKNQTMNTLTITLGTATAMSPGWGEGTWGSGTWGN